MANKKFNHSISCMGDSLTHNHTLSVPVYSLYPAQLQQLLQNQGCNVVVRNFGRSGNTTQQMITRFPAMTQFQVPDIGIIFGGVNDPGNGITQSQTQANIESMITSLQGSGVSKIMVVSTQYQNFSSAFSSTGDTLTTPYPTYATIRQAQQAAVNNHPGVIYVDLYNFLRNRIVNGQDAAGSYSWHVADGNQHFNTYGCGLVAQCILASIQAQGWDKQLV
jgi:lysophospholipase L1-like esterase